MDFQYVAVTKEKAFLRGNWWNYRFAGYFTKQFNLPPGGSCRLVNEGFYPEARYFKSFPRKGITAVSANMKQSMIFPREENVRLSNDRSCGRRKVYEPGR